MDVPDEKKGDNIFCIATGRISQSTTVLTDSKCNEETNNDVDTLCGLGSWTPKCIQRLADPKLFLFFHSMTGFAQGAMLTYFVGCMSTLEKRFAYDTKKSALLMISDEIAPILLGMVIGYFGGMSNRPKLMTFGMLMGSLSSFLMSLPYFIYGARRFDEHFIRPPSRIPGVNSQFCDSEYNGIGDSCRAPILTSVLNIFVFANFLKGFSSVIFFTIGTSYMDDSIKKRNSPIYLGTLFALRLFGPAMGFLLSSMCLQFYEDPFYDPGFGTKDPRWVGAWWLGFIIIGVFIFIFSIPMILFPRRFPRKKIHSSLQNKKEEVSKSPMEQLKDMGKAMKRLAKNPILVCHYLGGILRLNGVVGYYVLLPKYMEMQFRQSASKASLYSGPASIIGMQLGIMLGGISIRKFRPKPRTMTGCIVIAESFSVIALIACMIITCPVDQLTGTNTSQNQLINLENECNKDCLCTTKVYTPLCGPDGKSTYFSPCYAGCTGSNRTGKKEVFTDCKCVHNETGAFITSDANKSYCDFDCKWIVTFVTILSLGKLISSTSRVANALVTLRCVDPEDKSIALGTLSGAFSLLAFIPYPLIYGALTDASCLVWEKSCGKTGNCWIYDTDKFRFLLHGVSAGFIFLGCVTDVFVWILSPRLRNLYEDDEDDAKAKSKDNIQETEIIENGGVLDVIKTGITYGSHNCLSDRPT